VPWWTSPTTSCWNSASRSTPSTNAKLNGAIHVRFPAAGEQVLLLNGQTVTPAADTLLIADESRALALAGVMGGEDSGITLDTADLFLESAFFAPDAIAGRARAHGFSSDASYRFERGVDFALATRPSSVPPA
jgi:phenylalanyl-tRNA synthetase beta chain